MSDFHPLIDELESALASGNARHRLKVLQRVTDLFVSGASRYSRPQIALFDDVLIRLTAEIETKARARLSEQLADLEHAPPRLIRSLAFDDEIEVAAPVLSRSPQLTEADLVENASTKSQDHLLAIAKRLKLSEAVTDVLVERGDRRVVRSVVKNAGARFSLAGYEKLVVHAQRDRTLTISIGRRADIPRQVFIKLVETASASVREKLEAVNPKAAAAIRSAIEDVTGDMRREVREASRHHAVATRDAKRRFKAHRITESNVHGPAQSQDFEKTVVALTMLGRFPIDLVERALLDEGTDLVLILARAAGCSWLTAKALLLMDAAKRRLSEADLQKACVSFERLGEETAKRVLKFHEVRIRRQTKAADPAQSDVAVDEAPSIAPAPPASEEQLKIAI
jgi:uncharacterized protein (DUF2336 family)